MTRSNLPKVLLTMTLLAGVVGLTLVGCSNPNPAAPKGPVALYLVPPSATPTPTVTSTPTPNLTPVCGMTPFALLPMELYSLADAGIHVIQSQADWNSFIQPAGLYFGATPTVTPEPAPVDFTTQMVITSGEPAPCNNTSQIITNVCVGPTQVTVYVTQDTCVTCPQCNLASMYCSIESAVMVPKSDLPVSVVYAYNTH